MTVNGFTSPRGVPHTPPAAALNGQPIGQCRCRPMCLAPITTVDRIVRGPAGAVLVEHHGGDAP